MKRIKNSVKALIISVCVLVVAVATVLTVVLVTRNKDNPSVPGQKYVLTSAQKDLVAAINAKNQAEFEASKKTFTVGDGPLFVDEYGVAVDSNKITYVYDDYFTAEIDGTEEVFIFNPADETKTIRLSKYLKDSNFIKSGFYELRYYLIEGNKFVVTYKFEENEQVYIQCAYVIVSFDKSFDGTNVQLVYFRNFESTDSVLYISGKRMYSHEVDIKDNAFVEWIAYGEDSVESFEINVYSETGAVNTIVLATGEISSSNNTSIDFLNKGFYINYSNKTEIYTFSNLSSKFVYNHAQGEQVSLVKNKDLLILKKSGNKAYVYNFVTGKLNALDIGNSKINTVNYLNDKYFYLHLNGEKDKICYYDYNGKLIISYESETASNVIQYSNGRKILTNKAILSVNQSVDAYVVTSLDGSGKQIEDGINVSEVIICGSAGKSLIDINGNALLNGEKFDDIYRLHDNYFVAYDGNEFYLITAKVDEATKTKIELDADFYTNYKELFISGKSYLLVDDNGNNSLVDVNGNKLSIGEASDLKTAENIETLNSSSVANLKVVNILLNGGENIKISNGKSSIAYGFGDSIDCNFLGQSATPYGINTKTDTHASGTWSSNSTLVITYDEGYYPSGTIKFTAEGPTMKDHHLKFSSSSSSVTCTDDDRLSRTPSCSVSFNTSSNKFVVTISNLYSWASTSEQAAGPFQDDTSFTAPASEIYVKIITRDTSADYNNIGESSGYQDRDDWFYAPTGSWTLPTSNDSGTAYSTYTIAGGKYRTISSVYQSSQSGTIHKSTDLPTASYSSLTKALIIDNRFETHYRYIVYQPITYTLKVNYGVRPGTSTSMTLANDGLKTTYDASYTHTYGSTTFTFSSSNNPTTWFYRFTGWVLTGAREKKSDGTTLTTSYGTTSTATISSLCTTEGAECTLTAQWEAVDISVSFRFMFSSYDGMLSAFPHNKVDLRISETSSGLNGFNFSIGGSNKFSSDTTEYVTSESMKFTYSESKTISNMQTSNGIGIHTGKNYYDNFLAAKTVNSKYLLASKSAWIINQKSDGSSSSYYTLNSTTTIKEMLKTRSSIGTNDTTIPTRSVQIIVTYVERDYFIALASGTSGVEYITEGGGVKKDGSVIKQNTSLTALDMENNAAKYQFIAKKTEITAADVNAANTSNMFTTKYSYLGVVHLRIEVPKINNERAYVLSEVKLYNMGVYTNTAQTSGAAATVTIERDFKNQQWKISSNQGTNGYSKNDAIGRYNADKNQVSGLTAGQAYNSIEYVSGNDYYIYLKIYNLGVTICGGTLNNKDGTEGFKVEATAMSNQQPKDSIEIIAAGENNGSGQVLDYAIMNAETSKKVWVNNKQYTLTDDEVVDAKYGFVAKSEYNSVTGVTVSGGNDKKRDGKSVLANYGNTNIIVIRPNQSFYYSSKYPYILSGGNGEGSEKPLNYALQSYLSQINIDGNTYHFGLTRTTSGTQYGTYSLKAGTGVGPTNLLTKVSTTLTSQKFTLDGFSETKNNRNGNKGVFTIYEGYEIPSSTGRKFEIYLAQCAETHEIIYLIYNDHIFSNNDDTATTQTGWKTASIKVSFKDFQNELSVSVPNSSKANGATPGTTDYTTNTGSNEFIYKNSTEYDNNSVVYEYMYATAGTYGSSLGGGDSKIKSDKANSFVKFDSTGLRSADGKGTGGYAEYYGISAGSSTYLSDDRKFYINPNESIVLLFHPKDGYLISTISITIGDKASESSKKLLIALNTEGTSTGYNMDINYGTYMTALNNGYSYNTNHFIADIVESTGEQRTGVFVTGGFSSDWAAGENVPMNSVYVLISGISDDISVDVSTTSYLEFDFMDVANTQSNEDNNFAAGLFTQNKSAADIVGQKIDVLNKLQILYANEAGVWTKVSATDADTSDDPQVIKHQVYLDTKPKNIYRIIFFGNVNKFKYGIKFYASGVEYSSYFTNMKSYGNANNTSGNRVFDKINTYITQGNADIAGRRADGKSFYNNGSGFNYSGSSNTKSINSTSDALTYLYIRDIRKLFEELAPNDSRSTNIFNMTGNVAKEYVNKFHLKFDVFNNIVDYNIGSYLYNNNIYEYYKDQESGLSSPKIVTPLNSSNSSSNLSITTIDNKIKYINDIGAYQLDFVAPGKNGNASVLKENSWFNDVMISSIKERKTTINLGVDMAFHYTEGNKINDYYFGYNDSSENVKYWQDYESVNSMRIREDSADTMKGLYGYGLYYEYINIPGYKLQYLEIATVDYGNLYIDMDAIYGNDSWDKSKPYVVHLNKGNTDASFEDYFIAVSVEFINETSGKTGYRIRLYDVASENNSYAISNNYGDFNYGRSSLEIISNNIEVNFYLNAYSYTVKYNDNKGDSSPNKSDIKIIEGEKELEGKTGNDIGTLSQKVYYDSMTVLDYQLYMPGYTFIGWGSQNYRAQDGTTPARYDSASNTWNSSVVWDTPYKTFAYNKSTYEPWNNISNTDVPYDFYIKNNSLNGYFITDTGISGAIPIGDGGISGTGSDNEKSRYLNSVENYNFWYAYASKFTIPFSQEGSETTITLYGIWKANVYSLIFDTNDANIRGLESTEEEKNNEEYLKNLDEVRNGSTEAKLNVVTSSFAGLTELTISDYKYNYVQKTEFYDDTFTDDGRGYNVLTKDANGNAAGKSAETYYCYVAFDSDLWYITKEDLTKPDTYFSYFENATAGSEDASLNDQLLFKEKNNGNLLNMVIDRYGYTWLGWFKKKLDNTKSNAESNNVKNDAVFTSTYLNNNGSQTSLPRLDIELFNQFEDKCDFDITEVDAGGEPAPASESPDLEINKVKFVYSGEHKLYEDPKKYLKYIQIQNPSTGENIDTYISFYRYSRGEAENKKISLTLQNINGTIEISTKFQCSDDTLNKFDTTSDSQTTYLLLKKEGVKIIETILTYFDTSVSYDCYNVERNNSSVNSEDYFQIILNRSYSQVLNVEGEGDDKTVTLKRNKCNFRYLKLYSNWEVNQYTIVLDKQDNSSTNTLNIKESSTKAENIAVPDNTWYFDDQEFAFMLNNYNPDRIGYDFLGWSFYYYDINSSILEDEAADPNSYAVKLNKLYKEKNIINKPSVYLISNETGVESTMYLNQTLLNAYDDYILQTAGAALPEAPEGGEEDDELTEEEKNNQELMAAGLQKTDIIPLYTSNAMISTYANQDKYTFRNTYNTISAGEKLYQEQYGDAEHDEHNGSQELVDNGHYIYLFAIWRAQTFVINTSLNVEKQQLENLYDEDSRFAVAFYNAVKNQETPTVPETPEAGATAEEPPVGGEELPTPTLDDIYADYVTFTGINTNNYKLVYNLKQDYVYDKIDPETGKVLDPPTGTVTDNPVKKVQFTDIVATVYFTVTFDETLLDAYFNIKDTNGTDVRYYLKDLFAVSAGYYFLGWVTNVDGNKNNLSSGNYIVSNTLKTLFSNLDDHTDNVVLRPEGEETEEETYERLKDKIDEFYSRYVFNGQALTTDEHLETHRDKTIFNLDYYKKVYVSNYKHHFAENETYLKNNYTKLEDVNKYDASTNFGYVVIGGEKHYIQIDDLLSSQDATGLTSTAKKLHFRYNGWKYYVYYLVEIDGNTEPVVLQNDYENLYFVDNNKTKYIVRFDSEGYAYALTQQYPDYNKRLVFDHTNGGYNAKYPDEKEPLAVNLKIAVFLEGHNKVLFDDDGTFKNMDALTNLAQASSGNKYNIANLLSKDGKESTSAEMEFVPCQTRQFTVFAHWQNKTDLVMNVINSSNILPKEEPEEGEEPPEGEEPETPEGGEEIPEEEDEGPGYDVSPSYNPGLAGYYEIYDNSEHTMFNSSQANYSYSQSYINDGGEKKTVDQLDEKVEYKFNYYDSLNLNILPYYNGRYLSTVKFTYYGTEENSTSGPNIVTNTFRNMKYTLEFKFKWNDERRLIQLSTLKYTKSTAGNAEYYSTDANYQSLVLYKNYDEDDIRTHYYMLKDVGNRNEAFTEFTTFDSLGLLNDTGFVEVAPDGTEITEAERYYMMRIYEYFEYDSEANYDAKCKELGYILDDRTPQEGVSKYIIQDINKVVMNFPNIKTSVDIECQFSVQTFGINFYNILDEEGNTITVQAGKSNVYDTNYENEEEFKQAYENNEFFLSHENASKSNLPTIPQDCSYVDELTAQGAPIQYNVPYGYFIYGVYFKSAFSPHRPIDTGTDAEADGLPNNTKFLEYDRYGFDYIYCDGNYNIGTTSRLFKFSPVDEYDTDKHKYQCSPVLGSTSSFNEANGIRLDSLTFYMFGGWFEAQANESSGKIEFVLYNQLSEATYINRHINLYGYYYMVNTPTSITYYTWKEETQKYEPYAANKDQYALNANIENKPFNKQSDKLIKVEGFSSYTDSEKYAKIFTYQKYGVDATTFANDNFNEGDFNQNQPSDLAVLNKLLTTYWYYEDSYIVLKSEATGGIVKYDEENERFTLNGNVISVLTTDMVNFSTPSGDKLIPTKMYSENILKHIDDMGNYETLKKPVEGATLYYKHGGNYYPFKKLSSSSNYRYSLDINGDNSTDYYFLKKGSGAGSSKFIYSPSGSAKDAGESLEIIYNYYVVYDKKYYQIQYGSNPLAEASATNQDNKVYIPLTDGTIAKCYFDYKSKRLYDMNTNKEVRFLYEIYCAVNDNYAVNATYTTPKWGISGIKVKSLPSPNMTYWYNDEKYGLVGYIKLTDAIFEGMKKADSVFDGEGEESPPEPTENANGALGILPDDKTLYGDDAEGGEGEEPPPEEDDGIDESIKNGVLYKAFMNNIEIMYKEIWSEFLDDGVTENPNYDAKFKRELKFALGNYIGSYTKEQMLESFLIADEFHMNADNNAIEYITVNIPIKYSGEIPTKTEGVSRQVDLSIIIKYKFDIISTNTLVEENIYAIPIYTPYLMSFDTNIPCVETSGKTITIDVDKMDLWHFELTSKDTHVYNEENNDLLKVVILSEEEMFYLKKNMINDIPTMLTIMFNNYEKQLSGTLPEGELWINPNVGGGRVFVETFEMITNPDNTQYKKWSINANMGSLTSGNYYAFAFYEKTINEDILGSDFDNYVVRVSDNIIKVNYTGSIGSHTLITIDDVNLPAE